MLVKPHFVCVFLHVAGMQSQLVCSGCRSILLYPRGATNVCCALCNIITPVPPPGNISFLILFLSGYWLSEYFLVHVHCS